jgi:hypothetical protein
MREETTEDTIREGHTRVRKRRQERRRQDKTRDVKTGQD